MEQFKNQLENEYNAMIESVKHYKGFYVGRYEVSQNGEKAQSVAGVLPTTANNGVRWYGLYKLCKTYKTNSVTSSMIWGGQYKAVMEFIGDEEANKAGRVSHDLSSAYLTGGESGEGGYSGTIDYNDEIKHIYDLEGNVWEWTQEASSSTERIEYGGCYGGSYTTLVPSSRLGQRTPTNASYYTGSRLALYIEL